MLKALIRGNEERVRSGAHLRGVVLRRQHRLSAEGTMHRAGITAELDALDALMCVHGCGLRATRSASIISFEQCSRPATST
jgi:hypothetical protein